MNRRNEKMEVRDFGARNSMRFGEGKMKSKH